MGYSNVNPTYRQQRCDYYHCALYLFIIVACLLLNITNATDDVTEIETGTTTTSKTYLSTQTQNGFTSETRNNLTTTTTNGSSNGTTTSIFHIPRNMSDVRVILAMLLRLLAQGFIVFGGVIPYIPQYLIIKREQNAEGFSSYVCLTLLIANIIRIEFWFGKHFEIPLLLQSIVMIICMLVMLEIWTRVHALSLRRPLEVEEGDESISGSKEQLTVEIADKKFTDFDMDYFWRWTTFASYLQFLLVIILIFSTMTWLLLNNVVYIETIGFMAVFFEALLGMPQFIRNYRLKSTEGMSVNMVLLWASGDIFKTVYFILRNAPKQFWICGILQISIDVAILCQVIIYSNKYRFRET